MRMLPDPGRAHRSGNPKRPCYSRRGPTVSEMSAVIAEDVHSGVERSATSLRSRRIVPFTGAGISTECGIPDFRSPGGLWTRIARSPTTNSSPAQARKRLSAALRDGPTFATAKPGRGHRALASLYKAGKIPASSPRTSTICTKTRGSAEDVVELHGNTTYARCIGCGKRYELEWVKERFDATGGAPNCTACGIQSRRRPSRSARRCPKIRCTAPLSSPRSAI